MSIESVLKPGDLHRLMAWMSPSFPVGAFTYSHGLEWEVDQDRVTTSEALRTWIEDVLAHGAGWTDGLLLRKAWNAEAAGLPDLNDLALALSPTAERRLETAAQGTAFMKTAWDAWPWSDEGTALPLTGDIAYPVAVGWVTQRHAIPLEPVLHAYLHAMAANLVSAGVRLIPLGQTDGQRCLNGLGGVIETITEDLLAADPDDLGGLSFMADIASARHETLYTRLFRS